MKNKRRKIQKNKDRKIKKCFKKKKIQNEKIKRKEII